MNLKQNKNRVILAFLALAAAGALVFVMMQPKGIMLQGEVVIRQINISPKVSGRILEVPVSEGDFVRKGDIIAKIDSPEIIAKSEQAQAASRAAVAQYEKAEKGARHEDITAAYNMWQKAIVGQELAQKTFYRVEELFRGGVVSAQQLDEAKANYEASQREMKAAKVRYEMILSGTRDEDKDAAFAVSEQAQGAVREIESYVNETVLTAPRDGEISSIVAEEGELVSPGFAIATMLDLNDIWLTFNIREDLLKGLGINDIIEVTIPAIDDNKHEFRITYISKQGDFAVWSATKIRGEFDLKTFEVRAKAVNEIEGLRNGMSAIFHIKR